MNYLAHIYLSGDNKQVQIGNFIADFVKGDPSQLFNTDVVFGIELHHKIDRYTDTHPLVRACRSLFFEEFRHYSGVITDVLFDYFLAKNWNLYSIIPLKEFASSFYHSLLDNFDYLPTKVQKMFPYMVEGDWLFNYRNIEGIKKILFQLNKRTSKKPGLENSIFTLKKHHHLLETYFFDFFRDLMQFAQKILLDFSSKK